MGSVELHVPVIECCIIVSIFQHLHRFLPIHANQQRAVATDCLAYVGQKTLGVLRIEIANAGPGKESYLG